MGFERGSKRGLNGSKRGLNVGSVSYTYMKAMADELQSTQSSKRPRTAKQAANDERLRAFWKQRAASDQSAKVAPAESKGGTSEIRTSPRTAQPARQPVVSPRSAEASNDSTEGAKSNRSGTQRDKERVPTPKRRRSKPSVSSDNGDSGKPATKPRPAAKRSPFDWR